MRKTILFLSLAMGLIVGSTSSAFALPTQIGSDSGCDPRTSNSSCLSKKCDAFGTTVADRTGANLFACLRDETGTHEFAWKIMTSTTTNATCPEGSSLIAVKKGVAECKKATCEDGKVFVGVNYWGAICKEITHASCYWQYPYGSQRLQCSKQSTDQFVEAIVYQSDFFGYGKDNLISPEIYKFQCCKMEAY